MIRFEAAPNSCNISALLHENSQLELHSNSIYLCLLSLDVSEKIYQDCFKNLSEDEHLRAKRFKSIPARRRFVIARASLRKLLSLYYFKVPTSFSFSEGPFGKPCLSATSDIDPIKFNLSHSGDYVLLGFSVNTEIGVDVEHERELRDIHALAKTVYSDAELDLLKSVDRDKQLALFYQFWTSKEASLKADGTGFHKDPKSLCLISEAISKNNQLNIVQTGEQFIRFYKGPMEYSLAWAANTHFMPRVYWISI